MISKLEFQEWMNHPVTDAFMQSLADKQQACLLQLANNLSEDSLPNSFYQGYFRALDDVSQFDIGDTE